MLRKVLFATLLLCAQVVPAAATTLTTPTVYVPSAGSLFCTITNVSKKDLDVTVSIIELDGTKAITTDLQIAPGASNGLSDGSASSYYGRCAFDFHGSKNSARAATILYPASGMPPAVALPAQ